MDKQLFKFKGEGYLFGPGGNLLGKFIGETWAVNANKAKTNFEFQAKKKLNLLPTSKINFKGTITKKN